MPLNSFVKPFFCHLSYGEMTSLPSEATHLSSQCSGFARIAHASIISKSCPPSFIGNCALRFLGLLCTSLEANYIQDFIFAAEPYEWYIGLLRFRAVKHCGFGLGFERMVLFATGIDDIRDVISFPRYPGRADR
ncbi:asparagine--tRNA ligase [Pyrus ussuriensis x Pyrus communis]|uniref:Asparagine--tRNA ligase n=1 Tax=Pyrus ussuriensis x Pyrus communis TaxID=2448454 RepID=A0A5N5G9H8_9ROSA|nr:asparagine--tRNA ligase [Pyrus ussuriensis x Pyrus communis]